MKQIDKVALIIIENGKILSTKYIGKDKYYIPGGKRENNETDHQTLIREIKEELSVDILLETIHYVGTFIAQSDGAAEGINVKMTCYKAKYLGTLQKNNEIEEIRWLNYNHLDIISEVDKIIFNFLKKIKRIVLKLFPYATLRQQILFHKGPWQWWFWQGFFSERKSIQSFCGNQTTIAHK